MKISGGRNRNRTLRVPRGVRPTGGRIREALFSIWSDRVIEARFLDLFAGSGAVGLEALSRGARRAVFVERPGPRVGTLEDNCRTLGGDRWTVRVHEIVENSARSGGRSRRKRLLEEVLAADMVDGRFTLTFADPPYEYRSWDSLLMQLDPVVADGGEIAIEHSARIVLPAEVGSLHQTDSREYGESAVDFYRRATVGGRSTS